MTLQATQILLKPNYDPDSNLYPSLFLKYQSSSTFLDFGPNLNYSDVENMHTSDPEIVIVRLKSINLVVHISFCFVPKLSNLVYEQGFL